MTIEYPAPYWKDYELIDSGRGEKLERFGKYVLRRPEPKALWAPSLSENEWRRLCHVVFRPGAGFGKAGKEDSGTWEKARKMDDQWGIVYNGEQDPETHAASDLHIALRLGLTSFKHVGVFPEQAANWEYIFRETSRLGRIAKANGLPAPKVLNLFAYTGAASLAAKAAGADVTHLDSVRQVVTWARENMERSGLDGVRWVVEDATPVRPAEERRADSRAARFLHGPEPLQQRLLRHAGRNHRPRGLRPETGARLHPRPRSRRRLSRPGKRRACPAGFLRQSPPAEHFRQIETIESPTPQR